ncbi:uncharacterized protein [Argopecten irradians]|uniref:uncharacterized protein n=1 Tax=Argopecten irradians TaxID=31199 RepID=UPI003712F1D8
MKIIKVQLNAGLLSWLIDLGWFTWMVISFWDCVTAVDDIRMFKSSRRQNLQNMSLSTRTVFTSHNLTSLRCAEQCINDRTCVSFFYNKKSGLCAGHSITLGITNGSTPAVGNRYYVVEDGEGYIGDACTTTSDCYVTDSECRNGACWCAPGYSFWPSSRSCVANCTEYGYDFTAVMNHYIILNNEEKIENFTFQSCLQSCLSATLYTCVTFEYVWSLGECCLQSITMLDKPDVWTENVIYSSEVVHYQRDCA